jgi:alkylated DNA repair dioxygenase AlkB
VRDLLVRRPVASPVKARREDVAPQLTRARVIPQGLSYRESFLSEAEELELLRIIEGIEFEDFVMRGRSARRTVRHFGWRYSFDKRCLQPTDSLPAPFDFLRDRAERLAGLEPGGFEQTLITRYPPGATIGWHRDAPPFGPIIAGVSLGAPCRMRFRRDLDGVRYVHDQTLEPRSAYVLGGTARSEWEHSIPATTGLRFSVTFRTLAQPEGQPRLSA